MYCQWKDYYEISKKDVKVVVTTEDTIQATYWRNKKT
jgi:hypothetical protein